MGLLDRIFGQPKGRHALGAPYVFRPAAPTPPPPRSFVTPAPSPLPPAVRHATGAVAPLRPPAPAARQATGAPATLSRPDATGAAPRAPRGEITFRDGTTAELEPDQARELADIAAVLTRREEVKH